MCVQSRESQGEAQTCSTLSKRFYLLKTNITESKEEIHEWVKERRKESESDWWRRGSARKSAFVRFISSM